MQLTTLRVNIAENINQLSSDGSTVVEGQVTSAGITRHLNQIYLDEVFQVLADKYRQDFEQDTYPQGTYTATGTVDATSTGTTLVATTSIFDNTMEGFTVQNTTSVATAKIVTYVSPTQVTLDTTIDDDWDGDTIYVLGNEFPIAGDASNFREIKQIQVKQTTADQEYKVCGRINKNDAVKNGFSYFTRESPVYYLTTVDVDGTPTRTVGILPFPTEYTGKWKMTYIEKPAALSEGTDEPLYNNIGVNEILINGTTAWAFAIKREWDSAKYWNMLYEKGKNELIQNYKPKSRWGAKKIGVRPAYFLNRSRRR